MLTLTFIAILRVIPGADALAIECVPVLRADRAPRAVTWNADASRFDAVRAPSALQYCAARLGINLPVPKAGAR